MATLEEDLKALEETYLRIAGCVQESVVDGPGIRYTIFTQGCPFDCPGCQNPQTHPVNGGLEVTLKVIYDEIKSDPLLNGITFSGGEPFIQTRPLRRLARVLRSEGYSLWSYSGFTWEAIASDLDRRELAAYLDVVVDGPYVRNLHSFNLDYRGSSNQRIIDVQKSLQENRTVILEGYR